MESMVKVNRRGRRRPYGARDREELIIAILNLHDKGYSQVEIAKKLNLSRGTILRWNKEENFFTPRSPGDAGKLKNKIHHYDENYFSEIRTPNQAYLIGYILGDGTLFNRKKSKRLVLTLAEKDKQLLYDIANELNMSDQVKFRKSKSLNEQNKFSLPVSCTKLCNDLISLGITPNKTGMEKWIDFNDINLQWSFIRGFFDADGHIRVYQRNGFLKVRLGFTGSKYMMDAILKFMKSQNIGLNVNAICSKQGCYDLYFSSVNDVKKIYNYLYRDGDLKLNRKYQIFSSLMI
jgi:intein-encoded DNA endonuclease-like protein